MAIRRLKSNALVREGAPLLGLYWLYSSIRWFIARDSPYEAFENAFRIIHLERQLGIFHEPTIQSWLIQNNMGFVRIANAFYTVGYFPILVLFVALLYRFSPQRFQIFKLTFLLGLGFALVCFSLFPLAPPRMLSGVGFVDTQQVFSDGFYNRRLILSFYNPYAAMPSLHFGWALLVGVVAYGINRRSTKVMGVLYPSFMAVVIVTTGHHYILDIVGGGMIVGLAYGLVKTLPFIARELSSSPRTANSHLWYREKHTGTRPSRHLPEPGAFVWSKEQHEYIRPHELRSNIMASLVDWRPPS